MVRLWMAFVFMVLYLGKRETAVAARTPTWTGGITAVEGVNNAFPTLSPDGSTVYVGTDSRDEEGSVNALSATNGKVKWARVLPRPVTSAPAVTDDGSMVFVGSRDGKVYALAARTGTPVWTFETGSMITSSPVLSLDDETVYVGSRDFNLYSLPAANATEGARWKFATDGPILSSPTESPDGTVVYVTSGQQLYAVRAADGQQLWAYKAAGAVGESGAALSPDGRMVLVGGMDKKLSAIDSADGKVLWSVATNAGVTSRPAVSGDGGLIYVSGGADGNVYAFKGATGEPAWTAQAGGGPVGPLVLSPVGDVLYAGVGDKQLVAIDSTNGKLLHTYEDGGGYAPVAVSSDGKRVMAGGGKGREVVAMVGTAGSGNAPRPRGRPHAAASAKKNGRAGGGRAVLWPLYLAVALTLAAACWPWAERQWRRWRSGQRLAGGTKRKGGTPRRAAAAITVCRAHSHRRPHSPSSSLRCTEEAKMETKEDGQPQQHWLPSSASTALKVRNDNKVIDMKHIAQTKCQDCDHSWRMQGVTVGTKDLVYSVHLPPKKSVWDAFSRPVRKTLLHHVTFAVDPGEVTYLMGPSGAGVMSGQVLFNGKPRAEDFYDRSAYVRQEDYHLATLTVEETLRYAARLRIGGGYTEEEREERVETVVDLLGLSGCRDSIVGDAALRGISGGQKKRLSIAVEILHMPALIFLDEPTSGLDAVMSYEVMSFARELSTQQRTILATIHQPSVEALGLSSKVVLLKAGRLAYCGPTEDIVSYFTSRPLGFSADGYSNGTDFILACVSGTLNTPVSRLRDADADAFADIFNHSTYFEAPLMHETNERDLLNRPARFATSTVSQTISLLDRFWLTQVRERSFMLLTMAQGVVVGLICGALFWQMGHKGGGGEDAAAAGFSEASPSFSLATLWFFLTLYSLNCVSRFIPQIFFYKILYTRERRANAYSTLAYWATHAVINLPLLFLSHLVFFEIAYCLVGLSSDLGDHLFALMVTFLNQMVAVASAQLIASMASTQEVALSMFPLVCLFMQSFLGFAIPLGQIPAGWKWMSFVAFPRWAYEALLHNEFRSRPEYDSAMEFFGMAGFDKWDAVTILLGYLVIVNALVYMALIPPASKLIIIEAAAPQQPTTSSSSSEVKVSPQADEDQLAMMEAGGDKIAAARPTKLQGLMSAISEGSDTTSSPAVSEVVARRSSSDSSLASSMFSKTLSSRMASPREAADLAPVPPRMVLEDYRERSTKAIPHTAGLGLLFQDLEYSVGVGDKTKRILKGVSGHVQPGEMCALMGGSGAGKSTLLDILTFRKTGGTITGDYFIGGKAVRPTHKWSSYVTQDNMHVACFTVRETLRFAAQLRLEEGMSTEDRYKRAEDIMSMLGLDGVGDVLVGNTSIKGISGGQARRLTIGVEIMQLSEVIFLDEPTTGLDSTTSYDVMASVRAIADRNRTVVCTIHSPSESVFNLFDKLILVALGRQTYYGTVSEAAEYFNQPAIGWALPSGGKNPADFVMEASEALLGTEDNRHTIRDLNEILLRHQNIHQVAEAVRATRANNSSSSSSSSSTAAATSEVRSIFTPEKPSWRQMLTPTKHPRSALQLVRILVWRQVFKLSKMRMSVLSALGRVVVMALFHGSLYYKLAPDAIQARLSLLYYASMGLMLVIEPFIPELFVDRVLMYRERGAGVVGPFSYWVSGSLPYIPYGLTAAVLYSCIIYFMTGLNSAPGSFTYFLVTLILCSIIGLFFCQLISLSVANDVLAVAVFPAALFIVVAFCGFVVQLPDLPSWLRWGGTVSFARWAYQGLFINEFKGNSDLVFHGGGQDTPYSPSVYEGFSKVFGFGGYDKWDSLPILIYSAIIIFCLCYLPIRYLNFEKR